MLQPSISGAQKPHSPVTLWYRTLLTNNGGFFGSSDPCATTTSLSSFPSSYSCAGISLLPPWLRLLAHLLLRLVREIALTLALQLISDVVLKAVAGWLVEALLETLMRAMWGELRDGVVASSGVVSGALVADGSVMGGDDGDDGGGGGGGSVRMEEVGLDEAVREEESETATEAVTEDRSSVLDRRIPGAF